MNTFHVLTSITLLHSQRFLVVAAIGIGALLFLSFIVRSNLKIKASNEKNLPILIKMLISHLQVSSRIGEFGTQFPGLMKDIYSTQQKTTGQTPNTSYLDCLGMLHVFL